MSGLILPPLAMPLFASLKKKSGHLTRNSSGTRHLSKCAACSCTVERDFSGCGACLKVAYGSIHHLSTATWTISGTPAVYQYEASGLPYCAAPATPPSLNGSYVINCGVTEDWWSGSYVCTRSSGTEIYYMLGMRITNTSIILYSDYSFWFTGDPVPPLTPTKGPAPLPLNINRQRILAYGSTGTRLDDWLYEIGGSCDASCNTVQTRTECRPQYPSVSSDTNNYGGSYANNGVELNGISAVVEISTP